MKFRKKPVTIEAVQWFKSGDHPMVKTLALSPSGLPVVDSWQDRYKEEGYPYGSITFIKTLEGNMQVSPGDWIIQGVRGEFYPCKPDIFEMTYIAVEDESQ